jgi:hypothetical protein
MQPVQLELFVPDRFDVLRRRAANQLNTIIVPVEDSLGFIDDQYSDLYTAGRGGFLIFRGDSGSGKSTFLHTLHLFREEVATYSIEKSANIEQALSRIGPPAEIFRVIVIEGREALRDTKADIIEAAIHSINSFIRSSAGERTLIVWPCNTNDLRDKLIDISHRVGADSLLGTREPVYLFEGPDKAQYLDIAKKTVATLNQGASLHDLGVTDERAQELVVHSETIGAFLNSLRQDLRHNQESVARLLEKEQCRMWVVVIAGNDPDNDVAALTRGNAAIADIDRLLSATNATIVAELKKFPEKLGILGAVLDTRILYLPVNTALTIARLYSDGSLKHLMREKSLALRLSSDDPSRLANSDLGRAFSGDPSGPRSRGPKIGDNTQKAFLKLTEIASENDIILNHTIGVGLEKLGLIQNFTTENELRGRILIRSDLLCNTQIGPIRLEIMWRKSTGRADIANYTLSKIGNYAKAIGLLD